MEWSLVGFFSFFFFRRGGGSVETLFCCDLQKRKEGSDYFSQPGQHQRTKTNLRGNKTVSVKQNQEEAGGSDTKVPLTAAATKTHRINIQ